MGTASLETTVNDFNADTNKVSVMFKYDGVIHVREVNACLTEAGEYDPGATATRVADVGAGVIIKIQNGAITNPPPPPADVEATEA